MRSFWNKKKIEYKYRESEPKPVKVVSSEGNPLTCKDKNDRYYPIDESKGDIKVGDEGFVIYKSTGSRGWFTFYQKNSI